MNYDLELFRVEPDGEHTIMERSPFLTSPRHAVERAKLFEGLYKYNGIPRKFLVKYKGEIIYGKNL